MLGSTGHGLSRVPWLEQLLRGRERDPAAQPERIERTDGLERWDGTRGARLPHAGRDLQRRRSPIRPSAPVSSLRRRASPQACSAHGPGGSRTPGFVAVVTATSPRRLPHPDGGPPLTGTNPIAIAVPSSDGQPLVADVSMGAVTHGDVLSGRARPEELVPFGGPHAHKAFALAAGVELLVGALAGSEPGAVVLAARPGFDPGARLP